MIRTLSCCNNVCRKSVNVSVFCSRNVVNYTTGTSTSESAAKHLPKVKEETPFQLLDITSHLRILSNLPQRYHYQNAKSHSKVTLNQPTGERTDVVLVDVTDEMKSIAMHLIRK